ncbi:MAG: helix-turn-helix transcriptional regulator [Clostridia bacterium]|nr:helix-turn-helix transcriptional regulator [Clostridia bacterium]
METNRKINSKLGSFLWQCIRKSGMTYEAVADALGVSTRLIGYYCTGERKPSQITLLRFMRIANVETKDIPF